jgi:hypothetical protein
LLWPRSIIDTDSDSTKGWPGSNPGQSPEACDVPGAASGLEPVEELVEGSVAATGVLPRVDVGETASSPARFVPMATPPVSPTTNTAPSKTRLHPTELPLPIDAQ